MLTFASSFRSHVKVWASTPWAVTQAPIFLTDKTLDSSRPINALLDPSATRTRTLSHTLTHSAAYWEVTSQCNEKNIWNQFQNQEENIFSRVLPLPDLLGYNVRLTFLPSTQLSLFPDNILVPPSLSHFSLIFVWSSLRHHKFPYSLERRAEERNKNVQLQLEDWDPVSPSKANKQWLGPWMWGSAQLNISKELGLQLDA